MPSSINTQTGYTSPSFSTNNSSTPSIEGIKVNAPAQHFGVGGTNKYQSSTIGGGGTINEEVDLYETSTSEANAQVTNDASFADIYNDLQNSINKLLEDYENACVSTNVTLNSKYNFITSLDEYKTSVIGNASPTEEIFVYNTETGKYEKTTVEQWVSYILNGAEWDDFSVTDPNSPIQIFYLEDGETTYNVDYEKLKEYYNNLNSGTAPYIIDSNAEQYNTMLDDYDNLSNLYQQYNLFAPYIADTVTSQIASNGGRRYQNMSDEQLNTQLNEMLNNINSEIKEDIKNLGLGFEDMLDTMTRDQKIAFILTYKNENSESASQYLDMIKDSLAQTKAMNNVEKRLEYYIDSETGMLDLENLQEDIESGELELDESLKTILASSGYGLVDGVANFMNGFDYSNLGQTDVGEYTRMYFAMAIANSATSNASYTLGTSIGQMAPVVAMSYILKGAGVSSGITSLIVGAANAGSIFGSTLDSSIQDGEDIEKAILYSVLTAALSAGSEYILGGLPGLSKGADDVDSLAKLLQNMVNEGIQEGYEEVIDANLRKIIYNEPIDITELSRDAFLSVVYGGLTAGFYSGIDLNITMVKNGTSQGYTIAELQKIAEYMMKHPTSTIDIALEQALTEADVSKVQSESNTTERKSETNEIELQSKVDRYNELQAIINSPEYQTYMDYAAKGYAQVLRLDFEGIEQEFVSLEQELTDAGVEINAIATETISESSSTETDTEVTAELPKITEELPEITDPKTDSIPSSTQTSQTNDFYSEGLRNATNVKNEILATLGDYKIETTYDVQKIAKKLYVELAKRVHYNYDFVTYKNTDIEKANDIYNSNVSFSNFSEYIICNGWSNLFAELLLDAGIPQENIKIQPPITEANNNVHRWVEINLGDGNIIIADATNAIRPYEAGNTTAILEDLANCKLGRETSGYVVVNEKYSGNHPKNIYKIQNQNQQYEAFMQEQGKINNQIDNDINYSTNFANIVENIKNKFNYPSIIEKILGKETSNERKTEIVQKMVNNLKNLNLSEKEYKNFYNYYLNDLLNSIFPKADSLEIANLKDMFKIENIFYQNQEESNTNITEELPKITDKLPEIKPSITEENLSQPEQNIYYNTAQEANITTEQIQSSQELSTDSQKADSQEKQKEVDPIIIEMLDNKESNLFNQFLDYENNLEIFGNKTREEYIKEIYEYLTLDNKILNKEYEKNLFQCLDINGLREMLLNNNDIINYLNENISSLSSHEIQEKCINLLFDDQFYKKIDKNSFIFHKYTIQMLKGHIPLDISRLTDVINSYRNGYNQRFNNISLQYKLTSKINDEILIKYLQENNEIIQKFKNNPTDLTQEDAQNLIDYISVYQEVSNKEMVTLSLDEQNQIFNYINKILLENNDAVDLGHYQSHIYNFTKYYSELNNLDINIEFYNEDSEIGGNWNPSSNKIRFNTKYFNTIFKSQNIFMDKLEIIFHETFHAMQTQELTLAEKLYQDGSGDLGGTVNKYSLITTIDALLRKTSNAYYKNNYTNILIEIDARYNSFSLLKNYLKEVSSNTYEQYKNYLEDTMSSDNKLYEMNNNLFEYGNDKISLNRDMALDKIMKTNAQAILKDYPLLNYIYNNDGTRKTIFELESIRDNSNDQNVKNMINYWIRNSSFSLESIIDEFYAVLENGYNNNTTEYNPYLKDLSLRLVDTLLLESNYFNNPLILLELINKIDELKSLHPDNIDLIEDLNNSLLENYIKYKDIFMKSNASIILQRDNKVIIDYIGKNIENTELIQNIIAQCNYETYLSILNSNIPKEKIVPYLCERTEYFNVVINKNLNTKFDMLCNLVFSKIDLSKLHNYITMEQILNLSEENRKKFETRFPGVIQKITDNYLNNI